MKVILNKFYVMKLGPPKYLGSIVHPGIIHGNIIHSKIP